MGEEREIQNPKKYRTKELISDKLSSPSHESFYIVIQHTNSKKKHCEIFGIQLSQDCWPIGYKIGERKTLT